MADTRNRREIVDVGAWKPYDHPQHGAGAVRDVTYIDGTIERRFDHHGTGDDAAPDAGYLVSTTVDPDLRDKWDRNAPADSRTPAQTPAQEANTQATTAHTQATTAATIKEEAEKDANAAKGRGRLTDAQWTAELGRQEAAARAANNQAEANRLAQERLNFDKEKESRPDIKVTDIDLPNGRKGTRIVKTPKDGGAVTIENRDENGKPIANMPAPRVAEPPGAPKPGMRLGAITQGLSDYSAWLDEQVRLWQSSNGKEGMAPDAATKKMEQRRAEATSAIQEQTGIANAQGEIRSQDITQRGQTLTDTQSRRNAAREIYTNTLNQFVPQMKYLAPGQGATFVGAMDEVNRNALGYAGVWGGMRESPEVPTVGFLQEVRNMGAPGQAAGGPPTIFQSRPVPGAPAPATAGPPPDPAGAEAIRQQAAATTAAIGANAGALAAPPPPPPAAPAVNPVSTAPITVPPRPMATPEPPLIPEATPGGGNPAPPPYPAQPPMKQEAPAIPAVSPEQIPVGPLPYGQTVLPVMPTSESTSGLPEQMVPTQLPYPGMPSSGVPGPEPSPMLPGAITMRPTFLRPARYGTDYDPTQAAMARIMAGANPEIVAEAFELEYGRPLQMAG